MAVSPPPWLVTVQVTSTAEPASVCVGALPAVTVRSGGAAATWVLPLVAPQLFDRSSSKTTTPWTA